MQNLNFNFGSAVAVTPNDTAAVNCRALFIGGAGSVAIKTTAAAAAVTFSGLIAGTTLAVMIDGGSVLATGTTATLLTALA